MTSVVLRTVPIRWKVKAVVWRRIQATSDGMHKKLLKWLRKASTIEAIGRFSTERKHLTCNSPWRLVFLWLTSDSIWTPIGWKWCWSWPWAKPLQLHRQRIARIMAWSILQNMHHVQALHRKKSAVNARNRLIFNTHSSTWSRCCWECQLISILNRPTWRKPHS